MELLIFVSSRPTQPTVKSPQQYASPWLRNADLINQPLSLTFTESATNSITKILKLVKSYYELDHFAVNTSRREERYSTNAEDNIFMDIPIIFCSLTEQIATYVMFLICI
jgi:hypothetical protein